MSRKRLLRPKWLIAITLLGIVLILSGTVQLPYSIYTPSEAEELSPRVTVQGGSKTSQGAFLFTSTLMYQSVTPLFLLTSAFNSDAEIKSNEKALSGITNMDAYNQLLDWMETDAESSALIAVYKQLNRPIEIAYEGVMIGKIESGSPLAKTFYEGDLLVAADGKPITTLTQLRELMAARKAGDTIRLEAKRGSKRIVDEVRLVEILGDNQERKPGLGFIPYQAQRATPVETIEMKFDDLGGPSAGLMLALELLNQLDSGTGAYTRGYTIAGSGTIDASGTVGQVGGIQHKVVGADWREADFFFVPKDVRAGDSNERLAKDKAASIRTTMKVVPVATLEEAVAFLNSLPVKL